ncbi:hypothetical protein SARC_02065 [Sphaeroforma arctica JP610]|uniref:PROP1-like PPR domain-containing protein n=1 Tax=Sphaeroforma arctica JP610 TaxID=667725 RepID=A0A0L0GA56_9EUKA|nr:hypothetical protein SARC_02065 [Sphaeroforma arctica JP610]KNC85761.1 hypothetical protein SARC_02065 [Sphaeroforma arctica JP610]|eukprot:XP_014159663.1 hypothetical protein SARC_02065 [Sphaeroforma arctica JP610]
MRGCLLGLSRATRLRCIAVKDMFLLPEGSMRMQSLDRHVFREDSTLYSRSLPHFVDKRFMHRQRCNASSAHISLATPVSRDGGIISLFGEVIQRLIKKSRGRGARGVCIRVHARDYTYSGTHLHAHHAGYAQEPIRSFGIRNVHAKSSMPGGVQTINIAHIRQRTIPQAVKLHIRTHTHTHMPTQPQSRTFSSAHVEHRRACIVYQPQRQQRSRTSPQGRMYHTARRNRTQQEASNATISYSTPTATPMNNVSTSTSVGASVTEVSGVAAGTDPLLSQEWITGSAQEQSQGYSAHSRVKRKVYTSMPTQSRLQRSFHLPITTLDVWDEALAGAIPPAYADVNSMHLVMFEEKVNEDKLGTGETPYGESLSGLGVEFGEAGTNSHESNNTAERTDSTWTPIELADPDKVELVTGKGGVIGGNIYIPAAKDHLDTHALATDQSGASVSETDQSYPSITTTELQDFETTLAQVLSQQSCDAETLNLLFSTSISPTLELDANAKAQLVERLCSLVSEKKGWKIPQESYTAIAHAQISADSKRFDAREFFSTMLENGRKPSTELLGSMINAYLPHFSYAELIDTVRAAEQYGCHVSLDDMLSALRHARDSGAKFSGLDLFATAKRVRAAPEVVSEDIADIHTETNEFGANVRQGNQVKPVADDAVSTEVVTLPASAYADVLSLCADTSDVERADELLMEMRIEGVKLTYEVVEELLRLHVGLGDVKAGFDVFARAEHVGLPPTVDMYNAILSVYTAQNDVDMINHVLGMMTKNGVETNVVTTNLLLGLSCKNGDIEQAWDIINQQSVSGQANHIGYLELATYYIQVDQHQSALEVLGEMVYQNVPYDSVLPLYLMSLYSDEANVSRRFDDQMNMWRFLTDNGFEANNIAATMLILPAVENRNMRGALQNLKKLEEHSVPIDAYTVDLLIDGCVSGMHANLVRQVVDVATTHNHYISEGSYNALLDICLRSADSQTTGFLLENMKSNGFELQPSQEMLLLNLYVKEDSQASLARTTAIKQSLENRGVPIAESIYSLLAVRLAKEGQVSESFAIARSLHKKGFDPATTYSSVIQELLQRKDIKSAIDGLKECMTLKNTDKHAGSVLDQVVALLGDQNDTATLQALLGEVWAMTDLTTPATQKAMPAVLARATSTGTYDEVAEMASRMTHNLLNKASHLDPFTKVGAA